MRRLDYVIPPEYSGHKLVHFLRGPAGCSAALVKSLKQTADGILLNGAHARTIDLLSSGDLLSITLSEPEPDQPMQQSERIVPILYEDADVLVFDKPADMISHPAKNHQQDTLGNVFARICAERGVNLPWRPVNRLDRNTTGAVVAAKNTFAAAALAGRVDKVYLAVAAGRPSPASGAVVAPIGRPDARDIRRAILPNGQHARTEYRVLKTFHGYSALRCTLPTGRTHQIRVHMAHIGCPLLGDDLYGGDQTQIERQALHCARVSFRHPVTGAEIVVVSPIPQDMQKLIKNVPESQQDV